MTSVTRLLITLTLMSAAWTTPADVLIIDVIGSEPPNSLEGIPRPTNQMTMEQVRRTFGEPNERIGAVGHPPITRWVYDRYIVYFEYDKVISSVVKRTRRRP